MMIRIFAALVFCLATTTANAQTVQIGTGTDVPPYTLYGPVYRYSATSATTAVRCNMVFTQAEMVAAGIPPGALITSVEFNKTNSANFSVPATFEMYMANSSNTSLALTDTWADVLSTHSSVYSSTSFNMPLAAGWVSWNLATPFNYTGGALEIATSLSMAGNGGATDKFEWEYTASVPADKLVGVSNSTNATLNGNVSGYKHRPNIKITFIMPFPCTTPPTAGAATASPVSGSCANAPFQLDLTGNSSGSGQTYQWQSATTLTGTYTNVGGSLVAPGTVINPPSNIYYRAAVTCGTSTTYSTPVQVTVNPALPAGVYTIDPGASASSTNYTSFAAVANALACGIAGPVTFKIASGTYPGQVYIPEVLGASSTNRLTFEAASGDASDVVIQWAGTGTTDNYVVKLDGAKYITLKNLTFNATGATYARGIELAGNASNDSIVNCVITGPVETTSSNNTAKIFADDVTGSDNVIQHCSIMNGSYGIYIYGISATSLAEDWILEHNTITDANNYSIYIRYMGSPKIRYNTITTGSTTTHYCIYSYYTDWALEFVGNKITATGTGTKYGIYHYYSESSVATPGLVANNEIVIGGGSSTAQGIRSYYAINQHYYNNSVNVLSTSATGGIPGYFYYSSTAYINNQIRNNIFANSGGGYAMYVRDPSYPSNSFDYNNLYTTGNKLVDQGTPATDYATLEDWRVAFGWDKNSISYDPGFTSSTNLSPDPTNPASWSVNGRGVQSTRVGKDINGNTRPIALADGVPDLGAYEFTPTVLPPVATPTPATPAAGTSQTFSFGGNVVASIDWASGSTVPNTVEVRQYSGELPPTLTTVSPGSFMYFYTGIETTPGTYDFTAHVNYMDIWLGTIANESDIKMVKKVVGGKWFAYNFGLSSNNAVDKVITAPSLLDDGYFSGIENDVLFVAIVTPSATSFCPGDNVILTANPGNNLSYKWKRDGVYIPGANSISYQASIGGSYEVEEVKNNVTITSDPITIVEITPPPANITVGSPIICFGGREALYADVTSGITYQWQLDGADISGANDTAYQALQPGSYTVVVTGNGCTATSQPVNITAVNMPVAKVFPDTNVVLCNGDVVDLDMTVANTGLKLKYQWQNNGVDIPGATSPNYTTGVQGNYTMALSADNCPITVSKGINVFAVENPTPEILIGYGSDGIVLSTGVFRTYQWFMNGQPIPNAINQTYHATENGDYTVQVSNESCSNTSASFNLRSVGIETVQGVNQFISVHPNPASSVVNVSAPVTVNISITASSGEQIYSGIGVTSIDISSYPAGIYMMKIFDSSNALLATRRLIKTSN